MLKGPIDFVESRFAIMSSISKGVTGVRNIELLLVLSAYQ